LIDPRDPQSLSRAMTRALAMDNEWLEACYEESLRLARQFGPDRWLINFMRVSSAHAAV